MSGVDPFQCRLPLNPFPTKLRLAWGTRSGLERESARDSTKGICGRAVPVSLASEERIKLERARFTADLEQRS